MKTRYLKFSSPLLTTIFGILFFCSCQANSVMSDYEKEFHVGSFTSIYLHGPFEIKLSQANDCSVRIETSDRIFDRLTVNSEDGELEIEYDRSELKKPDNIKVYIQFKDLEKLRIKGAVELDCENELNLRNLKVEFDGAGDVNLNLHASKFIAEINGVGNFELSGTADYHKITFSGVGSYDAKRLESRYTMVNSDGIGNVTVFASEQLKGSVSGIGSVDYYGDPRETDLHASGIGSVNRH